LARDPTARPGNPLAALSERAGLWRSASRRDIAASLAELLAGLPGVRAVRVTAPDAIDPIDVGFPPDASGPMVPLAGNEILEVSVARTGRRLAAGDEAIAQLAVEQAALALEAARLRGKLEGVGRTRDEFVAAFGHELRDRLAPIFTSLTLLKMGEGKPEAHRQVIERQVAHLAHLVNDLIDVTHVARGELRVKREPVDLAVVVQSAIELARPLIGEKAGLAARVPRGMLWAIGDRQRLAQALAILLGGSITAEGNDLVLSLPAHAGRERPRTVVPPALTSGHPAGLRVLVVDDNVDAADTLATALRASGLEAHAVYGAVEALELVEARPFEVAVLDIGLPLMDGYELARRLRRVTHGDDLCLIALTGYGEAADAARSQAAGFRRHFVKPIQLGTLLAAIVQDVSRGPRGQA